MKSTPNDPKVILEAEDEQSSRVLESSHPIEITEAASEQSAGMESSQIPTEITEDEDDPLSGMESCDGTTTSVFARAEANPFMKDLPKANGKEKGLRDHLNILKERLRDNIQIETMSKFMDNNDMTGAQQKVEELFDLSEAIEFLIEERLELKPWERSMLKENCRQIDVYYELFMHALVHKNKLGENASDEEKKKSNARLAPSMDLLLHYEATEFMVFLINKVQGEEDILIPTLVLQETNWTKKNLITICVRMYEEEAISVFIYHVLKDEYEEAGDLFVGLINTMKPSDIINRGRLYNYALQRAEDLSEVHKFLTSGGLSQRYRNVVQDIDQLNWLALKYDNQVKVQNFLVDNLYLRDVCKIPKVMQRIDWAFVEKHDYPYLVKCVLAHREMMGIIDAWQHNWTEVKFSVKYAFTSAAAIGGINIMYDLLQTWPDLDVNASYKNAAALHIAAYTGNEEVVKYLLANTELDINVRTGRLLIADKGKKYNTNWWNLPTHQTALHIATARGHAHVVKILCDPPEPHRQRMRCHEEDEEERTPLDILYAKVSEEGGDFDNGAGSISEIEKILLSSKDVQSGIDRLYRNRQVLVDAVNTILVGAALIAGVTFAGWLQPPLGYAQYYDLAVSYPALAGTYDSYIAIQGNLGIKAFALFNSLSFFFAIATIIVAADAAFPTRRYKYIGHVIKTMQLLLQRAITFLIISLVCVLGAFGSAAIVILPPSLFFRKDLVLTIIIGGGVCCVALWQLLSRHSERVRMLNAYIASVISCTNVF